MNDCCLTQVGSGFEGLCGIPLPKHPFSHPLGILTSYAVFIGSHFTVISHSVWLSLNPSWKFLSNFHNQRKKRCKPSSLDLFNAHLRERSQYGLKTNIFEGRRMLPRTKIMVPENFNPTLGTKGFFLRTAEMLRCRPQAIWKVSDTQANFDQNSITKSRKRFRGPILWVSVRLGG